MEHSLLIERLFDVAAEARSRGYIHVENAALKELAALGERPTRKPVKREKDTRTAPIRKAS